MPRRVFSDTRSPMIREHLDFLLLLAILAFGPLAFGCVEPWSAAILQSAVFLLWLVCVLKRSTVQQPDTDRTLLPAAAFLAVLGWLQSLNPAPFGGPATLLPSASSVAESRQASLQWACYAALIWCVPRILTDSRRLRGFLWAVYLGGAAISVIGASQLAGGNRFIYGLRPVQQFVGPFGPIFDKTAAGALLAMAAFVGLGLISERCREIRLARGAGRVSDLLAKLSLVGCAMLLIGLGIYQIYSRGVLLAIAATAISAACLAAVFTTGRARRLSILTGLLLPAAFALLWLHSRPPTHLGSGSLNWTGSNSGRRQIYRSAAMMIRDFPLYGVGFGGPEIAFPAYQDHSLRGFVHHAHSAWLDLLLETGPAGPLALLAGGVALSWRVRRNWSRTSPSGRWLACGMSAAASAFVFSGIPNSVLRTPGVVAVFIALASGLSAPALVADGEASPARGADAEQPPRRLRIFAAAAPVFLFLVSSSSVVSSLYVIQAGRGPSSSAPFYLTRAAFWDSSRLYPYAFASAYFTLASGNPVARRILSRRALEHALISMRWNPSNYYSLTLCARILQSLGREADALVLIERARRVDFRQ